MEKTVQDSSQIKNILESRRAMRRNFGESDLPLPDGDRTPPSFNADSYFVQPSFARQLLRKWVYPPIAAFSTFWDRMSSNAPGRTPDSVLWSQRGNDYETHRRRLNSFYPLKGKDIFLGGAGMGREVPSWMRYHPASITTTDYFRYDRAWDGLPSIFGSFYPETELKFEQADLSKPLPFPDESFDVVGSDAVFEHCGDLPSVLKEMLRVLRPGGRLYSTFGPIYTSCGGDHYSGEFKIENAFDHILLSPDAYKDRVKNTPVSNDDQQEDFRTWIDNGLFSYYRYDDYVKLFENESKIEYLQICHNPVAYEFKRLYPQKWNSLLALGCQERDLLVLGMSVILQKP